MSGMDKEAAAFLDSLLLEVVNELERATSVNDAFNSAHEGYAVILEELDELWLEVKKKAVHRDVRKMKKEAVQVAAMAIRFLIDVCYQVELYEERLAKAKGEVFNAES